MEPSPPSDVGRRSALLAVKLRALVADHLGRPVDAAAEPIPHGAALVAGADAWVLIEGEARRSLGPALAWAIRHRATSLQLVVDTAGGMLARRAERFSVPVVVWRADGRVLHRVAPTPLAAPPDPNDAHLAFVDMITASGASPVIEHGVVAGEVCGLEVCRVVDQPTVGVLAEPGADAPVVTARREGVQLEVGVGAGDREAFQMLHGDTPTGDALATIVATVRRHRTGEPGRHPLSRLGRERLLRWHAEQSPALVGLTGLAPAQPPLPRTNLKDPTPCVAVGTTAAGEVVTVVFSAGVDLDLVPYVADVQATTDQRVVVALPGRDLLPLTRELADLLVRPVEFVPLDR